MELGRTEEDRERGWRGELRLNKEQKTDPRRLREEGREERLEISWKQRDTRPLGTHRSPAHFPKPLSAHLSSETHLEMED